VLLLQELLLKPAASGLGVVVGHMNNVNKRLEDSGECIGRNMELLWRVEIAAEAQDQLVYVLYPIVQYTTFEREFA
jgi:hypothetical protein